MTRAAHAGLLASLLFTGGCFDPGHGVDPPLDRFYFPVGLAVDADGERLYVANSDFDLQYNGGSLQALRLDRLRALVPRPCEIDADCAADQRCDTEPTSANGRLPSHWCVARDGEYQGLPCGALGEKSDDERWLAPGRCNSLDPKRPQDGSGSLIAARVGIGAFATDVVYRQRPSEQGAGAAGRLFIPVRGDATLHYVDVDPGAEELACGQSGSDGECADAYRVGDDPDVENTRDLRMPPEPFAIDATEDGTAIAITHQTDGTLSLFVNHWDERPRLEWLATGLPARVVAIAAVPEPRVTQVPDLVRGTKPNYQPGFLVGFRNSPEVRLFRYYADGDNSTDTVERPYLQQSGVVGIAANSSGIDSRGIAVDASERRACEASCADDAECLTACAGVPLGVYVGNRTPASLIVGHTRTNHSQTSSDDLPSFYDSMPLPFGVSRVVVGQVIDRNGELRTRVFAICFDERSIAIYDPEARRIERFIDTGRGPHALVIDTDVRASQDGDTPSYALGYVAHFTDSYIGVVDLDQRHERTYGEMVLSVGAPTPPRTSK